MEVLEEDGRPWGMKHIANQEGEMGKKVAKGTKEGNKEKKGKICRQPLAIARAGGFEIGRK